MRIKNFIKNYPITIFFIVFILVSISTIVVDNKVHATDSKNTPGCSCSKKIYCGLVQMPEDFFLCMSDKDCSCRNGKTIVVCGQAYMTTCSGKVSSGCGSTRDCNSNDCNPKCETDPQYSPCPNCRCGACEVYEEIRNGECEKEPDDVTGLYTCKNSCRYKLVRTF